MDFRKSEIVTYFYNQEIRILVKLRVFQCAKSIQKIHNLTLKGPILSVEKIFKTIGEKSTNRYQQDHKC